MNDDAGLLHLSATATLTPEPGTWVEVVRGEALIFAVTADGRRVPLGSRTAGQGLIGGRPLDDATAWLVSGFPGTVVRCGDLASAPRPALGSWASHLGALLGSVRHPREVVSLPEQPGDLPAGTHVAAMVEDMRSVRWIGVVRGSVTVCEVVDLPLDGSSGMLPMTREMWVTAGDDTALRYCEPPSQLDDLRGPLELLGQLALRSAVTQQMVADAALADRLRTDEEISAAAVWESIEVLTSSVGGDLTVPRVSDPSTSLALTASVAAARADGLTVDENALERAVQDVETGRSPVAALAAACGARPRDVTLAPGWLQREGRSLVAWVRNDATAPKVAKPTRLRGRRHGSDHHRHEGRAVALIWRRGHWSVLDPASGAEEPLTTAVADQLLPVAVEFVPVLPTRPETLRDLGRLATRGSGRDLALVGVTTGLIAATAFFTPYFLGLLADLFTSQAPTSAYVALFGTLILVSIAAAVWAVVRALGMLRVRSRSVAIASGSLWDRMLREPVTWHNRQPLGDRMAQANAVTSASASLSDDIIARLLDVAAIIGSLAAIATINGTFLIVVGLVVMAQLLVTGWMLRLASRRARERVDASAAATGLLLEVMRAVNRIRVAGAESRVFLRWAQVQARYTRADQALRRISMYQGVVIAIWPILALASVFIVSQLTQASFGDFITAQTAAAVATGTVAATSLAASSALIARRALDKAQPLLDAEPESGADGATPGVINGRIEARDLVFRYGPDRPAALDHVSFSIQPGEQVAIVGASGSGKTTLMRVLLGLETPESGVITIDDQDLATLNAPAVRRQIGSVLQSSQLLPGPVRQNIDLGRGLTTPEIWAALEAAAVGQVVRAMPLGLDTPVSDGGGTISGGQRQRILIARALAGSPRIIMLDEATSALDNVTQAEVIAALQRLRVTRVVIAHRLSTIRQADRIIVMSGGRIVEEGTYDELIARPGPFRDLTERQQL